jgi:hypothetical protein
MEEIGMKILNLAGLVAIGAGMLLSQPAQAVVTTYDHFSNPARACQLSIPTTDTKVRPKATGYRNEGTTNQFAICGLDNLDFRTQSVLSFGIGLTSMDGAAHTVSCTAVNGVSGVFPLQYSTTTINVPATAFKQYLWDATNFGGAADAKILGSLNPSITCILPPNVAIIYLFEYSDIDIGT